MYILFVFCLPMTTFTKNSTIMKKGSKEMLRQIFSNQALIMKALKIDVPVKKEEKPVSKANTRPVKKVATKPTRPASKKTVNKK